MDKNVKWFYEKRAAAASEALAKNRITGIYVAESAQVPKAVLALIPAGSSIAFGGSMTIFETGLYDALRQGGYKLLDRFEKGVPPEEIAARQRQGLLADVFVAGVNAVTEQGELVFVDASCTRVAPVLYGPKKVILVAGCNKIVPNLAYAQERIRHFVAPANAKRLGRKTPCAETGQCLDCDSPERICNATVVIHKQADPKRMHVVFVGETLGL
jgi:hypothetical protein